MDLVPVGKGMNVVPSVQRINVNMNVPGGGGGGRLLGPLGYVLQGASTVNDLKSSLDRGEGFARLPGLFSKFVDYLSKDKKEDPKTSLVPGRKFQPGMGGGFAPTTPKNREETRIEKEPERTGSDTRIEKEPERTGTDTRTGQREAGPRLDMNATQDFKDLFNAGVANKDKIQQMYAGNENLQKWAAANPALAQREFNKMNQRGMIEQSTGNKLDPTTGFADVNDPNIISLPDKEETMSIAEFVKQSDQPAFSTQQDEAPVKAQDFLTKRVGNLMNKSAKDVAIEMDPNDYFKTGYNLSGLFDNQ